MHQALDLPQQVRADLVALLIRSLDPGDVLKTEALDAWVEEAKGRAEANKRGELETRPWEVVRDEIRERLSGRSSA